ncbi:MAG: hypothetical protein Q8N15_01495, partial [Bacillota bacterium]|nr:hypothetical protein [Bacillota bacterium]
VATTAAATAQEILDQAAAALSVPAEVTSQAGFFLFYTDEVVTCDWESDNADVIDVWFMGGEAQMFVVSIQRPATVDASVTLTATLSYGTETKIVTFIVLVRAENTQTDPTPTDLLAEDLQALTLDAMVEMSTVDLPTSGLNGSTITWELQATDSADLVDNTLTLHYIGRTDIIVLLATLWLGEVSDDKFFFIEVSSRSYSTIETLLSHPVPDVFLKATVYFFYERGFFVFDGTGLLNVYADDDWSDRIALGDEVVLSGDMVNGYVGWELWFPSLETIVSSDNPYEQPTHEYIFGVSFPRPFEISVITGTIQVIDSIVYLYSGQARIAIIELSTYNDSYDALKAFDGQTVTIKAANYYFYSTCYGFLYQEGAAGITVVG